MISNNEHLDPDRNELPPMDAQYFIDKFSAIPDSEWRCDGLYGGDGEPKCALGHCGLRDNTRNGETAETSAFYTVILNVCSRGVTNLNDCPIDGFPQTTPKARILAALELSKSFGN